MFTIKDILETNQMITQNNLDVRTITMGISLRDCGHPDIKVTAQKVYDKITRKAEKNWKWSSVFRSLINVFL